jgi:hypothetical protein
VETNARPNKILYKSDWPKVAPVLKAGETLTFSGGEYRQDNPTMLVLDGKGNPQTVPTPGVCPACWPSRWAKWCSMR